ncbi:MAG: glycoside hydrolase family 5 protein [Spirochaetales bacterium]|nr:glycoside hydrolase family 5 protein [Spirochaetales bacterium]
MPLRKNSFKVIISIILGIAAAALLFSGCAQTVVQKNGRLQVIGTQLCNERGEPVQLKGMSFMDIAWFGDYANPECFKWLRDDWGCTVIRAALYTVGDGRFRASDEEDDMIKAVQAAIDTGLYVIIDWHILYDGNPMEYKAEAISFFKDMAALYKDTPNVLYEICNEPNGDEVTWSGVIKPYAEEVITEIRKIDQYNVILVGTPHWSQFVDVPAADPLDFDNIMYVNHFYTGTHGSDVRNRIDNALQAGLPVFISEWGATEAEQNTGTWVFPVETFTWLDFINERGLSWANWSITIRKEPSAALKHIAASEGGWDLGDLTESGLLVRSLIRGQDTSLVLFADSFETENYSAGRWDMQDATINHDEASEGYAAALLKKQSTLTKTFSTKALKNIRLQFTYKTEGFSAGDYIDIEWFDGNNWQQLKKLEASSGWSEHTLSLPQQADNNARFQLRFVAGFSGQAASASIDEVELIMDRLN